MSGDLLRDLVRGIERRIEVGGVCFHDRDDLVRIAPEVWDSDPVRGTENLDRRAVRRQGGPVVDVVDPLHLARLPRVDLENHPIGEVQPRLVVTDRRRWDQITVLAHPYHLDQGNVEVPEEPLPRHLGGVREMDVAMLHFPGVDLGAAHRVRLIRHAQVDPVGRSRQAVQFGGGRGTGPHTHGEAVAGRVGLRHAPCRRRGHHLGVTGAREPAHPDRRARCDQRGGLLCGCQLACEPLAADPAGAHSRSTRFRLHGAAVVGVVAVVTPGASPVVVVEVVGVDVAGVGLDAFGVVTVAALVVVAVERTVVVAADRGFSVTVFVGGDVPVARDGPPKNVVGWPLPVIDRPVSRSGTV